MIHRQQAALQADLPSRGHAPFRPANRHHASMITGKMQSDSSGREAGRTLTFGVMKSLPTGICRSKPTLAYILGHIGSRHSSMREAAACRTVAKLTQPASHATQPLGEIAPATATEEQPSRCTDIAACGARDSREVTLEQAFRCQLPKGRNAGHGHRGAASNISPRYRNILRNSLRA